MKPPDLVDCLSVPLAAEDDHEVVDLYGRVGVKAARAGPTADRMPAPSHWGARVRIRDFEIENNLIQEIPSLSVSPC